MSEPATPAGVELRDVLTVARQTTLARKQALNAALARSMEPAADEVGAGVAEFADLVAGSVLERLQAAASAKPPTDVVARGLVLDGHRSRSRS